MSAALVLPIVWACDQPQAEFRIPQPVPAPQPVPERLQRPTVQPGTAFYRRYTEAMLRRYVRMSLEVGRTPSLLGREMFRAKVTSYRVQSFEDVVIFVHDMEKCLAELKPHHQEIITRMALQEYTVQEAAALLGIPAMSTMRLYNKALDRLTAILLHRRMLERQNRCQAPAKVEKQPITLQPKELQD